MDYEEESKLMKTLYEDVNDLYQDEHMIMTQADLLEQMYNLLHEIHMVARDHELVYLKTPEEDRDSAEIMDPDKFPINKLTVDLIKEYESIWSTKKGKKMRRRVEKYFGHSLEVRDSEIDHHLAGKGVFMQCKR